MSSKPKCMLTVDVEAFSMRAPDKYIDTLIYGRIDGGEWGIGKMMDIADRYGVQMTFFLDFAEAEFYGNEITDVGKYIVSRGHELQVHCHADCFEDTVHKRFPHADKRYTAWYEDSEVSQFMVDYCLEQYHKCTDKTPIVFRGGAYRFGTALLKKLKERGVTADASYNCLRPKPLPMTKQFTYENGLLELPISVLPGVKSLHTLNFNSDLLYPVDKDDRKHILKLYEKALQSFYDYYGKDAIASLMMHSWSFCYDKERYQSKGYFDKPNIHAAEFFEQLLSAFIDKIDFITASQAVQAGDEHFLKKMDFKEVFSLCSMLESENLRRLTESIRKEAGGREIVVWGKGWLESEIVETLDIFTMLHMKFYISRDARYNRLWRNRPVVTFEEAGLSPRKHYVLVCAQPIFPEIRETLKNAGFLENKDYYDIVEVNRISDDRM